MRVYINDTISTLIESMSLGYSSAVPVINSEGFLLGSVFKVRALKWLIEQLDKGGIESSLYIPISETDLVEEDDAALDIFNLHPKSIIELMFDLKHDHIYVTHSRRLIGEISHLSLLDFSLWAGDTHEKVSDANIKPLETIGFDEPLSKAMRLLESGRSPRPIGVVQDNTVIGLIYLEGVFEFLLSLLRKRSLFKLPSSKCWVISTTDFPYVYIDEPITYGLRELRRHRQKNGIVVFDLKDELEGYVELGSLLERILDRIDRFMNLQVLLNSSR